MLSVRISAILTLLFPTVAFGDTTANDPGRPPPLPPVQTAGDPPPLPPPPAEDKFFYAVDGAQQDAIATSLITARIKSGQFACKNLVWKKGMQAWEAASTVVAFRDACADVPATPPPPPTDWTAYLTGTWTIDGDYQGNKTRTTATYTPDGRVQGVLEMIISGAPYNVPNQTTAVAFEGKWEVKPLVGERFTLTTTNAGATPGQEKSTSVLRRTGANSLYNETQKAPATRIY